MVSDARHIEVQVLGDGEDAVHCLRARMLAAAPPPEGVGRSPGRLPDRRVRVRVCRSAVALAKAVNYKGAGTIEYLYDARAASSISSR
jgi:acetyl-CoA carboxylase biotin carboxylase subunit